MLGGGELGSIALSAVLELRVAFLAGSGVSVDAEQPALREWLHRLLRASGMHSSGLHGLCTATEIAGQALILSRADSLDVVPWNPDMPYVALGDPWERQRVVRVVRRIEGTTSYADIENIPPWTYVRTGGDDMLPIEPDGDEQHPTSKLGRIVTQFENFDRCVYQMRLNNYRGTKVTPVFTESSTESAQQRVRSLESADWKAGDPAVVTGDMKYAVPSTGAVDSILIELRTAVKNISGVTGVPVSWSGHVDLLSNRATAQVLYDQIAAATLKERTAIEDGLREACVKALEQYNNAGGRDVPYSEDITIRLPLMSETEFNQQVQAWVALTTNGIASIRTARENIPGIDPYIEDQRDEEARQQAESMLALTGNEDEEDDEPA